MNNSPFSLALLAAVALVALSALARLSQRLIWKVVVPSGLTGDDNLASGIEYAGHFLGVLLIAGSVLSGMSLGQPTVAAQIESGEVPLWGYAVQIAVYGGVGILVLALFGRLGLRLLLRTDIPLGIRANNRAAGVVAAGGYVSTSLVIGGAFSGQSQGGDFSAAAVFLLAGLAALWGITYLYRFVTNYDDAREITNGNVAAALSYAGMMVAVGLIVGHAIEGNFTDYQTSFILFGKALLAVAALYPVRQFIVQGILLGGGIRLYGGLLDDEVRRFQNSGAGAVEAAAYIGSALLAMSLGY